MAVDRLPDHRRRPSSCWKISTQTPGRCGLLGYGLCAAAQLQGQLDLFTHYYNHIRPHRALHRRTPLQAYSERLKARPTGASAATYFRVRQDPIDKTRKVSLRYDSRLHHIGLGRAHKGRQVKLLVADRNIRVIHLQGQLIRELTLDPTRDYQPLTAP